MSNWDNDPLPVSPSPNSTAARIYAHAAQQTSTTSTAICEALGISPHEARTGLEELVRLGLVQHSRWSAGEYLAVNPMSAALHLLAPAELGLRHRQQAIDRLRGDMRRLLPLYEQGTAARDDSVELEVITDLHLVRILLEKLAGECESEVLTSQPGGSRDAKVLDETARRDQDVLERGIVMRTLYQHSARFDPVTCDYVQRIVDHGAEVRTTGNGFMRFIVYDRRTAILTLANGTHGALVVRAPDLLHFVTQSFDWAWSAAEPFPVKSTWEDTKSISEDVNRTLLRLLVNGMDDQRIARQLGVSLRTCQRRISDLMNRIGAQSRLHAGYLISQQRLIDPQDPEDFTMPGEPTEPGRPRAGLS